MPQLRNAIQLSPREMEVMKLLWKSEEPLLASEIAKLKELSINTINTVLKRLLSRDLIRVADIVHSGTVLSRRYCPNIQPEEYTTDQFISQIKGLLPSFPSPLIVSRLLEEEEDMRNILALEAMIRERKRQLKEQGEEDEEK